MSKFSDKIMMIETEDLPALAGYMVELMRKGADFISDTKRLTVPKLAQEINVGIDRIRAAIRAGHYGHIHPGKREIFYATASEARAYHFGSESKTKKSPPKR